MFRLLALAGFLRPLAGVEVPFTPCEGVGDELGLESLRLSPARLDGERLSLFASGVTVDLAVAPPADVEGNATTVTLLIEWHFHFTQTAADASAPLCALSRCPLRAGEGAQDACARFDLAAHDALQAYAGSDLAASVRVAVARADGRELACARVEDARVLAGAAVFDDYDSAAACGALAASPHPTPAPTRAPRARDDHKARLLGGSIVLGFALFTAVALALYRDAIGLPSCVRVFYSNDDDDDTDDDEEELVDNELRDDDEEDEDDEEAEEGGGAEDPEEKTSECAAPFDLRLTPREPHRDDAVSSPMAVEMTPRTGEAQQET